MYAQVPMESLGFMGGVLKGVAGAFRFAPLSPRGRGLGVWGWVALRLRPIHTHTRTPNPPPQEERGGRSALLSLVIPDVGRLRVGARAEVAERHQRLAAGVVEDHARPGGVVADEHLVLGQLP